MEYLNEAIRVAEEAQEEDGRMYREVQGLMREYPADSPELRVLIGINEGLYYRQVHRAVALAGARARRRGGSVYDYVPGQAGWEGQGNG